MSLELEKSLSGINSKDAQAWESLYSNCYSALCVYAEGIISDEDNAKDIVQDVLIKVWHSEISFNTVSELTSYLYVATYNNSLVLLRNKKKRETIVQKIKYEQVDEVDDVFVRSVREEIIRQIYVHLEGLPKNRREIIKLSLRGYSGKEIAEELGISINTVKVQKK